MAHTQKSQGDTCGRIVDPAESIVFCSSCSSDTETVVKRETETVVKRETTNFYTTDVNINCEDDDATISSEHQLCGGDNEESHGDSEATTESSGHTQRYFIGNVTSLEECVVSNCACSEVYTEDVEHFYIGDEGDFAVSRWPVLGCTVASGTDVTAPSSVCDADDHRFECDPPLMLTIVERNF